MKSLVSLQIDTDILLQLITQLRRLGGSQDLSAAITSAVACWLDDSAKVAAGADPAGLRGYQWKSLFLPEGTVLRSWSYGEHNYARVEGDQIIHLGRAVTPNQFAQSFARSTRSAWRDLYVRRPGDKQFKLASRLRRELAQPEYTVAQAAPAPPDPVSLAWATLLSHAASPAQAAVEPAPGPRRDGTPEPGWNLPERRKLRYRIEDVAFD